MIALRKLVSSRECLNASGEINYQYFTEQVNRSWLDIYDTPELLKGIAKHGVAKYDLIR